MTDHKKLSKKQKIRYIEKSYSEIDFMLMEALASCAIEGNPMYHRVGKVYGWIWGDTRIKTEPTDEEVDSVYKLMKGLKNAKRR